MVKRKKVVTKLTDSNTGTVALIPGPVVFFFSFSRQCITAKFASVTNNRFISTDHALYLVDCTLRV
jgi:hypothetical protein